MRARARQDDRALSVATRSSAECCGRGPISSADRLAAWIVIADNGSGDLLLVLDDDEIVGWDHETTRSRAGHRRLVLTRAPDRRASVARWARASGGRRILVVCGARARSPGAGARTPCHVGRAGTRARRRAARQRRR